MSSKALRLHPQARLEVEQAFDWYFERSTNAAGRFLDAVDSAFRQIVQNPERYPAYTQKTRRFVLDEFPYAAIYQVQDEVVLVLAMAHAKRRPRYWHKRI